MSAVRTWRLECGDALERLARVDDASIDLVCTDPPFCTGRSHAGRTRRDRFDDRWPDRDAYLAWMSLVLREAHRVLAPRGAVLLHCDWRTCHHLWIELERIFGADRAVNHLVWSYGLGGSGPRAFARKHDDILYFARGAERWFEPPLVPSRSRRMAGAPKKATDVIEIPAINNMGRERCGWPTQKPLALLERLVGACCPPGGLVLDPFCGSGTTLVAAHRLGRRSIGFDRAARAIELARARLAAEDRRAGQDRDAADADAGASASRSARRRRASARSATVTVR